MLSVFALHYRPCQDEAQPFSGCCGCLATFILILHSEKNCEQLKMVIQYSKARFVLQFVKKSQINLVCSWVCFSHNGWQSKREADLIHGPEVQCWPPQDSRSVTSSHAHSWSTWFQRPGEGQYTHEGSTLDWHSPWDEWATMNPWCCTIGIFTRFGWNYLGVHFFYFWKIFALL